MCANTKPVTAAPLIRVADPIVTQIRNVYRQLNVRAFNTGPLLATTMAVSRSRS